MSKKIIWIGLLTLSMPVLAQDAGQGQGQMQGDMAAPSGATEGRVFDEGQVQVPREGQVEDVPEGHVEAIHPAGGQPRSQETQPDLFRFESRLFNPIPSDE